MSWYDIAQQYLSTYVDVSSYSDTQWKRYCNVAVQQSIEAGYSYADSYTLVASGNVEEWYVTPDPSEDTVFISLIALKVWCNLYNNMIINKALNAASVRDGTSAIDTRGSIPSINSNLQTPCDIFEQMLTSFEGGFYDVAYNFALERE